ncbi:MAG: ankyrin repeat domain-containing protein [Synergistaceae bacterium]|nr:ankyrin repeat domain-containing protein [Synergistaceae bacterium]
MQRESIFHKVIFGFLICLLCTGSAFAAINDSDFVELCQTGSLQQIVDAVKDGASVNASNDKGVTPLISAAARDAPDSGIVTVLIEAGAQVNYRTEDRSTPIMWAASDSNSEIVEAFIKAGADVNARNADGITPLMCAAEYNASPQVTTALIEAGAEVHARNTDGLTPLMFAAARNPNHEVIKRLINAGADVNAKNAEEWTPLMLAAWKNSNPEVIITLLDLGADPKVKNNHNRTAMDFIWGNEKLRNTDAFRKLSDVSY